MIHMCKKTLIGICVCVYLQSVRPDQLHSNKISPSTVRSSSFNVCRQLFHRSVFEEHCDERASPAGKFLSVMSSKYGPVCLHSVLQLPKLKNRSAFIQCRLHSALWTDILFFLIHHIQAYVSEYYFCLCNIPRVPWSQIVHIKCCEALWHVW